MNGALWLLPLFAVGYALWAFFRLWRMERNEPADGIVAEDTPCRQEIIGRSRFVLDPRHSRPQAAVESETEKVTEKADIFVPICSKLTPWASERPKRGSSSVSSSSSS